MAEYWLRHAVNLLLLLWLVSVECCAAAAAAAAAAGRAQAGAGRGQFGRLGCLLTAINPFTCFARVLERETLGIGVG